eukprot:60757_1
MGSCQDCSRESLAKEMVLEQEAKACKQNRRPNTDPDDTPSYDTLLKVIQTCCSQIFNYAIGQHIYDVLIDEEYQYVDDIVYDLDCYQSNIISLSTQHITNNKLIKYEWNDNDREILYSLLLKIFKHNVTTLDSLLDEFVYKPHTLSLSTCTKDALIASVEVVVHASDCIDIDIQCVKQFFTEKSMNGEKLCTMSMHTFVSLAKEYCISASKARKLLHAFKQHSFDDGHADTVQNGERREEDVLQEHWNANFTDVMNDKVAKKRVLRLCSEEHEINEEGTDKGFVAFLKYYLYTKNVNDIFSKCGAMDCISNSNDLMNALSIVIIFYKVKVFQMRDESCDHKLRIDKAEILSVAKYVAIWITLHYGWNGMYFKMSKEDFKENIHLYFEAFVKINVKETQ